VGKPRPVGEAIVNHLFPPGESGRVPLVAVSGTSGRTFVASLVASMLAAASRTVGEASSRGLRIGRRMLSSKNCTDAVSARRVLVNPFVDAMVIETDAYKVVQEGLAFDRCGVAVVTNLHADEHHLDEKERVLVAKAVRAPVDVVLPDGCAVLNADDPEVAAMAVKCRGRTLYFGRDGQSPLLCEHLGKGGQAVFIVDGAIVTSQMEKPLPMFELDPSIGATPELMEGLLAAVGAGVALGLTPHSVREGIETALVASIGSSPTI
jgi:cyanophycin synthetase